MISEKIDLSRLVPLVAVCAVILSLICIPLKVISYGYLPEDDALRHAAKAVSGKPWDQILVLRDEARMDNHPGWHAILSFIHKNTGPGTEGLVVFSVISLFIFFCLIPPFFLRRPEAWLASLLVMSMTNVSLVKRLFFGRPYIVSMAAVVILCFVWPRLKEKKPYGAMILIGIFTALAAWVHGSWYLFALPIACFFLAREWRAGLLAGVSIIAGILIGASLTGDPYAFLRQNLVHMFLAFGNSSLQRMLVAEFQAFTGDTITLVALFGMLGWRAMRGAWDKKAVDNPVFILIVAGWALGFVAKRFWFDWAMPAMAVWMACEFQDAFEKMSGYMSWRRLTLSITLTAVFWLAMTTDINGRWTQNLTAEYLCADDPKQAGWLPEKGGIVYSDDMTIFYDTFFKNPKADWRYILGFEPALMPPEDLAIFRKIQWNYGAYEAFGPWVSKMKPEDRLVLRRSWGAAPAIPGLEWHYAASGIWVGRLKKQ
ncbi:MAG: hypothetical protein JW919_01030 [Candidatus Omnitrophica bacterium]|nr:hypothetical protein [Candidatus Omnitrophota bacterium]